MMPEPFDIALCVLGRVISRPTPDVMTLDTGSKAVSVDAEPTNCRLLGLADAEVLRLERGTPARPAASRTPKCAQATCSTSVPRYVHQHRGAL